MTLRTVVLATAILSTMSCGEPDRIVLLTCPSPDGASKAIFWVYSAGPAAGVVDYFLNVVPADRSTSSVLESNGSDDQRSAVMDMGGGGSVHLTWLSSKRLLVEYPEDASLRDTSPGWPVGATGVPGLRVVYRGSDAIPDYSDSTCESGTSSRP
ncbi:MAG TPA: hypothetical protein VHD57_08930 [Vicinamibacterales bacterium]|jgi:hypothetical protein|nr:hypothetical protein [Vicinamibacterales bacterium]